MTLALKRWKRILNAVKFNNSSEYDVLEQIKAKLREQDEGTYQEWEQKGFDIDHLFTITRKNVQASKCTLLHLAAQNSNTGVVKALLEKGPDIDAKDNHGSTPLHSAARNGNTGVVKALLEKGADIDAKDNYGSTPLHSATQSGNIGVVKALLEKGADIDAKDNYGSTPLHSATQSGNTGIVKALLEKGADINAKDNYGSTPLHLAARNAHENVVIALLQKRADPFIKNKEGKTPRDLDSSENVIQLLKGKETQQISKAIKIGVTLGIITALTVGIECGIAGVELSTFHTYVVAALVAGGIAVGIKYAVLKPNYKLDKPNLQVANQQVNGV